MIWIDEVTHHLAVSALLGSGLRDISLVDWTSFVVMREQRLDRAFAFDSGFARQGFEVIPP
jgi:predicted nucleic acid-binding protein